MNRGNGEGDLKPDARAEYPRREGGTCIFWRKPTGRRRGIEVALDWVGDGSDDGHLH